MKAGELCAGYGGLALAVEEVFGAETAWFSEFDPAPSKILKHHWPHVPNHGDMTAIDWAAIEQVDVISGGTPCQDLSGAGRRKGMTEGTRSNLWVNMRESIAQQQPEWVVWENVRGAYSATADSDLEHCTGCMGGAEHGGLVLRALGRVLGDLSDLGYDCQWRGLRAADVGACHGRFRVFVLARRRAIVQRTGHCAGSAKYGQQLQNDDGDRQPGQGTAKPTNAISQGLEGPYDPARTTPTRLDRHAIKGVDGSEGDATTANTECESGRERRVAASGEAEGGGASVFDPGRSGTLAVADTDDRLQRQGRGNLVGSEASGERAEAAGNQRPSNSNGGSSVNWGDYEPAIRRWESQLRRSAPRPTEPTGRNGGERLSPRFTEWMMGLADGWVTDPAIGISRNDQLKACGNGVVPQQAIAALKDMLNAYKEGG